MQLVNYYGKEFEISKYCNLRIGDNGGVYIYDFERTIYLESIKTEDQLLQLLSLLTGKDQEEFKIQ